MALQVPTVTLDDLRAFHAKHFPHAPLPEEILSCISAGADLVEENYDEGDDGLGYYANGAKRTLTDEQIAIFRHTEIQTILRKRRLKREEGELSAAGDTQAEAPALADNGESMSAAPTPSDNVSTPNLGNPEEGPLGATEKPRVQQWTKSSTRTKERNKRNRNKYKKKKREERQRREAEDADNDVSDEWDPWHQANGPDVQKHDTVDLDY
ncbi:hypothetical protein ACN47E_007659 [Coniothyrium glycines]